MAEGCHSTRIASLMLIPRKILIFIFNATGGKNDPKLRGIICFIKKNKDWNNTNNNNSANAIKLNLSYAMWRKNKPTLE